MQGAIKIAAGRTTSNSAGFAASLVVRTTPGKLVTADMYNSSGGDLFLLIFDATAVPSNGAMPATIRYIIRSPTQTTASANWEPVGRQFVNGVVLMASSTDTTVTIAGASCLFDATHDK